MEQFVLNNILLTEVDAPASKSFAQRILLASALCNQSVEIANTGYCDDVLHMKSIIKQIGSIITEKKDPTIVNGNRKPNQEVIKLNCGESGLGIRLTAPVVSALGGDYLIHGKGSLLTRPHTQFEKFLPKAMFSPEVKIYSLSTPFTFTFG